MTTFWFIGQLEMEVINRYAPFQEYLLQGSVLDTKRDVLLHRLNGLCDITSQGPDKFCDHEMMFILRPQNHRPINVRVRKALQDMEDGKAKYRLDVPAQMKYVAQPDGDRTKQTLMRKNMDMATTPNVEQFLQELGFKKEHEFVARGYQFRKGRLHISVYKVTKMNTSSGELQILDYVSNSSLVEMSVVGQANQDQIQEEMKLFAQHLKPLVNMEKHPDLNQLAATQN